MQSIPVVTQATALSSFCSFSFLDSISEQLPTISKNQIFTHILQARTFITSSLQQASQTIEEIQNRILPSIKNECLRAGLTLLTIGNVSILYNNCIELSHVITNVKKISLFTNKVVYAIGHIVLAILALTTAYACMQILFFTKPLLDNHLLEVVTVALFSACNSWSSKLIAQDHFSKLTSKIMSTICRMFSIRSTTT